LLTAEKQANALSKSIDATLIQYRMLDKWNGRLPNVTGSSAIPFLNIDAKDTIIK